jgi:cation diffusion facilitator CzcD-associated flavoprotein CzcO
MLDSVSLATTEVDVLIVGSGFSGIAMAIKLQQAGMRSFLVLEKAADVGGTWRDNTYPGAACDIPSHLYSLSFEPRADWTRMYPQQPELQSYLRSVADKHRLRDRMRFNATMTEARWDEALQQWRVVAADGSVIVARVLVSAVGALHHPAIPSLPGMESFAGLAFHSSRWESGCDLAGKRVAVIGTGASAIQFIPEIAPDVAQLDVYQRTPPWVIPKPDGPISSGKQMLLRLVPFYRRLFRARLFWMNEIQVLGFLGNLKLMRKAELIARRHMRAAIDDPELLAKVTPDYTLGCKRVLFSNTYYPALARANVELVTSEITEVRERSIVTADGAERPADVIIYGTGFLATESMTRVKVYGRDGVELSQRWHGGMEAYYGMSVPGFPNYFMLLGPNTGLGHNSVVIMIEAQVRYLVGLLKRMRARGLRTAEVKPSVLAGFIDDVQRRMAKTVWQAGGCRSWYQDANGRNTTLWPGSVVAYVRRTRTPSLADYETTKEEARGAAPSPARA